MLVRSIPCAKSSILCDLAIKAAVKLPPLFVKFLITDGKIIEIKRKILYNSFNKTKEVLV